MVACTYHGGRVLLLNGCQLWLNFFQLSPSLRLFTEITVTCQFLFVNGIRSKKEGKNLIGNLEPGTNISTTYSVRPQLTIQNAPKTGIDCKRFSKFLRPADSLQCLDGDEWIRFMVRKITPTSLKDEVDHLWLCVLGHFFPFSEHYLVVRGDLRGGIANASDITVKQLRSGQSCTILTMQNKQASSETKRTVWAKPVEQLKIYLNLVPAAARPNLELQVGLVGIGEHVPISLPEEGWRPEILSK